MANRSGVGGLLKKELGRAEKEVQRFTAALVALGGSHSNGRSTLSAAGRKRIAAAQRARWAKQKQAQKPKRTMSASARRRSEQRRGNGGRRFGRT